MDKHSFPNGKRLVRDTLKPVDNLHYEKFSDGTVKCIEDEIPFDVPDNWEWVRLGAICPYGDNKAIPSDSISESSWILDLEDIEKDTGSIKHYATKAERNSVSNKYAFTTGQLLYSKLRPYLNKVVIATKDGYCTTEILPLIFYGNISAKYMQIFMMSPTFLAYVNMISYGVKMPRLGTSDGKNALIAIPPINEQLRIRKQFDIIIPLLCKIEKHSDTLHSNILATKSKILDLAIRGKLVAQDPNDEPASVLLERIRAEKEELIKQGKIKHDKKESVIFKGDDNSYYEKIGDDIICIDDEIPFETPINWQWVRLGSTVGIERGGSPRPIKSYITTDSNGINWIKIGDVDKDGKYITNTKEKIKPTGIKKSREVYPGDFLLTNSMSFGRPYISKIYGCVHDGWLVLRNPDVVFDINFLYYLLSSNYLYNQFVIKASGSTVDNLNIDKVSSALICLPPLKEQTMIVNQIEKIIRLIQPFEELL